MQRREKNLENAKVVIKFERRLSIEVRKQEKLDIIKEQDFRRKKLLRKYTTKMLYGQNDRKFEKEYLVKVKNSKLSLFFFLIFIYFLILGLKLKLQYNVTVKVTQSCNIQKNIEGFGIIILYSIFTTY